MKRWICLTFIVLIMLLSGCNNRNSNTDKQSDEYQIYYLDSKTSEIVSENYQPKSSAKEDLVGELLDELQKEPEHIIYTKAIPDTVTVNTYNFVDDQLIIDFGAAYSELTGIPEVLCRATVIKTLSQIQGVDIIQFNVNGQPLTDSNGAVIGFMTEEDFIVTTYDETNYMVTLYFANEAGDKLIETNVNIYNTGTGSIEEKVINQLINGSTEIGMYDTIPEGTVLLSVTTKEGICYVDLNEKFLEGLANIKNDKVTIYSIVNSLVELPSVNKVQFLINGEIKDFFRENIEFNGVFDRNLDIIMTEETKE